MLEHIVRYGIASEKRFFTDEKQYENYDTVAVNANMLAFQTASIARFLSQELVKNGNSKPFFFDPQTHAFQHDPTSFLDDEGNPRAGLLKLSARYGSLVNDFVASHKAIRVQDLTPSFIEKLTDHVVEFQTGGVGEKLSESGAAEYIAFVNADKEVHSIDIQPKYIVPPYFYIHGSEWRLWLRAGVQCLRRTLQTVDRQKVAMQLVLSEPALVTLGTKIAAELQSLAESPPIRILLWIDDFNEHHCTSESLKALKALCVELSKIAPIINLYGSAFSILAGSAGALKIVGVGHGLEYGESRRVVPVGGGLPVSKFYHPKYFARLAREDAMRTLAGIKSAEEFYLKVCSCIVCKQTIKGTDKDAVRKSFLRFFESTRKQSSDGAVGSREFPTKRARELCVNHFLHSKSQEFSCELNASELIAMLRQRDREYCGLIGKNTNADGGSHLRRWADGIADSDA